MVPRGGVAIDGLLHGLTHLTAPLARENDGHG